jgi:hypothetical protein
MIHSASILRRGARTHQPSRGEEAKKKRRTPRPQDVPATSARHLPRALPRAHRLGHARALAPPLHSTFAER